MAGTVYPNEKKIVYLFLYLYLTTLSATRTVHGQN